MTRPLLFALTLFSGLALSAQIPMKYPGLVGLAMLASLAVAAMVAVIAPCVWERWQGYREERWEGSLVAEFDAQRTALENPVVVRVRSRAK